MCKAIDGTGLGLASIYYGLVKLSKLFWLNLVSLTLQA